MLNRRQRDVRSGVQTVRFLPALVIVLALPVLAGDEGDASLALGGVIKFEYFGRQMKEPAGKRVIETDFLIDEAELTLDGKFNAFPDVSLVLATERVGTSEREPVFVKEFILTHRFDSNCKLIAGRMKLPFGAFRTATFTDPQTKQIGETKTDAGLGVVGKHDAARLEWSVVAFADDYRTPGHGADGVTANAAWNPTDRWTLGAGIVSNQYARAGTPPLADVFIGVHAGAWKLSSEYVGALTADGGEKPRAWSVDGAYRVASRLTLGVRRQIAERRFVAGGIRSRYDEWALAFKYQPYPWATMGVEYLTGRRRGEPVDYQDVGQITGQAILSF